MNLTTPHDVVGSGELCYVGHVDVNKSGAVNVESFRGSGRHDEKEKRSGEQKEKKKRRAAVFRFSIDKL